MNILDGYKTYITAFLGVAIALAHTFDIPVPMVTDDNAASILLESILAATLRRGIKKTLTTAPEADPPSRAGIMR